ncbi:hypothetical protein L6452_16434 [Arctium lappa]|uniref:Uncharacterized protein n=1 Tax=Arctium lappa TaxID=4217 RepID=A0ACB9C0K0_ARCLA|nr:hypothetical protein L6452_16434 [Arctium lappa]
MNQRLRKLQSEHEKSSRSIEELGCRSQELERRYQAVAEASAVAEAKASMVVVAPLAASGVVAPTVFDNPNITVHYNTETMDVVSNTKGQMSDILINKHDTGEESELEAKGLFYGIGHTPNNQLLEGQIDLDNLGYILISDGIANTSVEGVFAAGDVQW